MAQRLLLTITALLAICTMCHADGHVRGIVTDEKGEAMVSVVIKVYGAGNNKMLKYALSGKDGRFDIPVKEEWLPTKLTFSYIGYRLKEVTVSDTRSDNKITMTEEALSLKEVTVKSAPISSHGDTLLYNVAAFRSASDRNIEDVIRKLPGISVSENGTISYQGESINKFYIEGLDLLSGRYALATRNISPDDIASVSIYENHQPKKVLKDISFSEKAALNLKLKNNRMLKPTGTVTAGAGYGDNMLWKGELYGMIIGTGSQHLVTVKTNNDGTAYGNETRMLTAGGTYVGQLSFQNRRKHNIDSERRLSERQKQLLQLEVYGIQHRRGRICHRGRRQQQSDRRAGGKLILKHREQRRETLYGRTAKHERTL